MHKILTFKNAEARIFSFAEGVEVEEIQIVIGITNPMLSYREQAVSILSNCYA